MRGFYFCVLTLSVDENFRTTFSGHDSQASVNVSNVTAEPAVREGGGRDQVDTGLSPRPYAE